MEQCDVARLYVESKQRARLNYYSTSAFYRRLKLKFASSAAKIMKSELLSGLAHLRLELQKTALRLLLILLNGVRFGILGESAAQHEEGRRSVRCT